MSEILWLGLVLGVGAALAVGPIFVIIIQESALRGFGSGARVIIGSAAADVLMLLPALAFTWLLTQVTAASFWVGLIGAGFLVYLAMESARDARRMWQHEHMPDTSAGWSFWKGLLGNLVNPLSWSFWLLIGTPKMLYAYHVAGWPGLVLFNVVWFGAASGLEAVMAMVVARSRRMIGVQVLALLSAVSALLFLALAGHTIVTSVMGGGKEMILFIIISHPT